jgi:hypothetical protein
MSNYPQGDEEKEERFQAFFDNGLAFGQSDELSEFILRPERIENGEAIVSAVEMAHALHLGGAVAGLAIRMADLVGEENAYFMLQQASRAVAVHCEHKRAVKAAN